jgi:hAT family C-terminal dimerisation region
LCKSVLNLKHVVDPVVSAVNFIKARGLNHRQFKSLLVELESEFSDVLYHTNVRWLSLGKVLKRVWNLREEIVMFMEMKDATMEFSTQMKKSEWQSDFAFAVDILEKLNELNLKLQGKGVFAHELYAEVKSFQVKLMLFSKQLKEHNYSHFPTLQLQTIATQSAEKYSNQLSHLKEEFARRFADFKSLEKDFALLTVPFTIDIDIVPAEIQLELIDLQNDIVLKEQFRGLELIQFFSSLRKDKFANLQTFAMKMFTLFASTYICEQTFSTMNLNKSKCRSQLTDANLTSIMRIATSTLVPDFGALVKTCSQLHTSH